MFGDACEWYSLVAVIHDRRALVVARRGEALEIESAIIETAMGVIEITIKRTAVDDMVSVGVRRRIRTAKRHANIGMIEDAADHRRVAIDRDGLPGMIEI